MERKTKIRLGLAGGALILAGAGTYVADRLGYISLSDIRDRLAGSPDTSDTTPIFPATSIPTLEATALNRGEVDTNTVQTRELPRNTFRTVDEFKSYLALSVEAYRLNPTRVNLH